MKEVHSMKKTHKCEQKKNALWEYTLIYSKHDRIVPSRETEGKTCMCLFHMLTKWSSEYVK